jgi:hypothetical protein
MGNTRLQAFRFGVSRVLLSKATPRYISLFLKRCLVHLVVTRSQGSKSSGEIHRLSLTFIDLYVPVLTLRL